VVLGVAAATAVLTGALLVGDSVRGSLKDLTLGRLGKIDEMLVMERFFRRAAVDELMEDANVKGVYAAAVPVILFPHATIEGQNGERAAQVLVIASEAEFWELDSKGIRPSRMPGPDEIVINQAVADEWGASIGDEVVLRLPKPNQVPADNALAKTTDRIRGIPGLKIVDIVPTAGLGRFGLRPSQKLPRNVYVSLAIVQRELKQEGKVNAALVSLRDGIEADSAEATAASEKLAAAFQPTFEDYGLTVKRITKTFGEGDERSTVFDYYSVSSDRMILSPAAARTAQRAFLPIGGRRLYTYLANSITKLGTDGEIPYSTITAIELGNRFNLLSTDGQPIGPLADGEIVLNSWAAADRGAQVGDTIRVTYFAPETTHGQTKEESADFTLKAITPLTEPDQPFNRSNPAVFTERPCLANDPDLTPAVEGVTDQDSIENWDPPFPFDYSRVRIPVDDDYWKNHRTTPKAFISISAGKRLWASRFGDVTSIRIPAHGGLTEETIKRDFLATLRDSNEKLGFTFIPIKRQQLAASNGTTPFDALFLSLSFFIIAAALLLVALLFRLGIEQRAAEIGILLASGLSRRRVSRMLVVEGGMVAAVGAEVGVFAGIGYAWLMLEGLRTWWVGAITVPFLQFHATSRSLAIGYTLGVLISAATIWWSVRQMRHISVSRLLAGQASDAGSYYYRPSRWLLSVAGALVVLALLLLVTATRLAGMPQAGAFVAGGAALLTGLLLLTWARLRSGGRASHGALTGRAALAQLALRNAARNPSRSAITIGLIATASFLIVAMSSFRVAPSDRGAGGFDLIAESAEPIYHDLNSPTVRLDLLASDAAALEGGLVFGLHLRPGDDASCNNLYKPQQPQVMGLTNALIQHFDNPDITHFAWTMTAAGTPEERVNPWRLLQSELADNEVPVIIDMNTAMYSLKPPLTVGSVYRAIYDGVERRFRVVGLLENSVLQGSLLVGEKQFKELFPNISGYRYFLIQTAEGKRDAVIAAMEDRLGDQGFDAVRSSSVLEQLLAVQNTYLSTFQSLGALGLLLGTFGLAAIQLRSVIERRGELALLRATGFTRRSLGRMVLIENVGLLLAGLTIGVLAALLAVLPHRLTGTADIPPSLLRDLAIMLSIVLVVGIVSGLISVRAALRTPVLAALRGD
jgi:ABC-type antimicrobial peptide transport system permease subunit